MYSTSYYTGDGKFDCPALFGNSFLTAIRQMIDTTSFIWFRLKEGFRANTEEMRAGGNDVTPGNGCAAGPVVGRETILGYPTVAIQWSGSADGRITVWQSPDLSCFPLKLRYERRFPDGNFHLLIERLALKVNKLQVQKAS